METNQELNRKPNTLSPFEHTKEEDAEDKEADPDSLYPLHKHIEETIKKCDKSIERKKEANDGFMLKNQQLTEKVLSERIEKLLEKYKELSENQRETKEETISESPQKGHSELLVGM